MKTSTTVVSLVVALALTLLIQACGKDQTVEDYNNSKTAENIAKANIDAGTYGGTVSSTSKSALGSMASMSKAIAAMQLTLQTSPSPQAPNDQGSQPVGFDGKVTLITIDQKMDLTFTNAQYTNASRSVAIAVNVPIAGGGTSVVKITGTCTDTGISGTISVDGDFESGGTFNLVKNQSPPSPSSLQGAADAHARLLGSTGYYTATYDITIPFTGPSPVSTPLSLTITSGLNSNEKFVDFFLTSHTVTITMRIGSGSPATDPQILSASSYDSDAQTIVSPDGKVNCKAGTVVGSWNCTLILATQTLSNVLFTPSTGGAQ